MKHKTKAQIAKEIGISRETLRRIAKLPGAPASLNADEWRAFYGRHRVQPLPGVTAPVLASGEPIDGQKLDYQTARTVRMVLAAERERIALEQARSNLMDVAEAREIFTKAGTVVKMGLLRMCNDLPPVLEGRGPVEIQKILRAKVESVLTQMADAVDVLRAEYAADLAANDPGRSQTPAE